MHSKQSKLSFLFAIALMLFFNNYGYAQQEKDAQKYEVANNGVTYKFIEHNQDAPKPKFGEVVTIKMDYYIPDSLLFTYKKIDQPVVVQIIEPLFEGDFYQALGMMSIGDSASFQFSADSIFTKMFGTPYLPNYVKPNDIMTFNIKLDKIQSKEEALQEMQERQKKMAEEKEATAALEISNYIKDNKITVPPTANGLYVVIEKPTKGVQAKAGDKVSVHYTAKLMDGKEFDSSVKRGKPIEFVLGKGNVIKGWDEGIAMMKVGEKAQLIIPYQLAYGARGANPTIPPFANLIFDVELLEIKK